MFIWKINPFTNKVKKGKSYDYMILFIWLEYIDPNIEYTRKTKINKWNSFFEGLPEKVATKILNLKI
jgi:hypothetical protein